MAGVFCFRGSIGNACAVVLLGRRNQSFSRYELQHQATQADFSIHVPCVRVHTEKERHMPTIYSPRRQSNAGFDHPCIRSRCGPPSIGAWPGQKRRWPARSMVVLVDALHIGSSPMRPSDSSTPKDEEGLEIIPTPALT